MLICIQGDLAPTYSEYRFSENVNRKRRKKCLEWMHALFSKRCVRGWLPNGLDPGDLELMVAGDN